MPNMQDIQSTYVSSLGVQLLTDSSWFRNESVIPPEIEPMKRVVAFGCGGTN
jgi:hypothetical protein